MFLGFASPQLLPELARISVKENLDQRLLKVNAVLRVLSGSLGALLAPVLVPVCGPLPSRKHCCSLGKHKVWQPWAPKGAPQKASKSAPKVLQNITLGALWGRFWGTFGALLSLFLGACWGQNIVTFWVSFWSAFGLLLELL